jgi:hypothetical protein
MLQGSVYPTGYSVTSKTLSTTNGTTDTCVLSLAGYANTANFTAISAGN